jgi:hypothetical protein
MKRKNRMAIRRLAGRTFIMGPLVFLLVAGAGCPSLFESPTQRATHIRQAEVGKDGDVTISADTVVNVYAPLAGTVNPVAGDKTLTVTDATFLSAVTKGDLLLIVQMAGATTDTTNTASYGTILAPLNLGGAGLYEFIGVEGKSGTQVTLACGLKNGYSLAGKTQVIRVPQYANLTINSGFTITALAWNGTVGGVVAVHAENTLQLDGSIDVSGKGFRGGAAHDSTNTTGQVAVYRSTDPTAGGEKGEGIAGYGTEYTTGQYGRGAPANAGGGGDSHNGGGGGGANARSGLTWTGQGVMLATVGGAAAWALDPSAGANTRTNSEGGGRGGYSYSNAAQNPLATAPGDATWGGDDRREIGGLGGHPLDNDPTSRLFMGGGGGAGDGNNGVAGPGGRGGGLIFIIAGAVTGSGAIHANGAVGGSSTGAVNTPGDAAGGGGGGGTAVVNAATIAGTVAITANGGPGGNHTNSSGANEVEGPGGGGSGGYIALSGTGAPALSATGGLGGTTTVTPSAMANFRTNGATAGNAGLTDGNATNFLYCGGVFTTFATHPASHTNSTAATFAFTNTSDPVTYECKLDKAPATTGTWAACSGIDAGTEGYVAGPLTDGTYTLSVRATDSHANVESPVATYTWTIDTVAPVTTIATHPETTTTSTTGVFTFTVVEATSPPVTYACKLDTPTGAGSWAACNASTPTTAGYTTGTLTAGGYTLTVRATDQAGNVETNPHSFAWTVESSGLDGGVDAESVDSGLDSGGAEASSVLLDAEGIDALASDDVVLALDTTMADLPEDSVAIKRDDTAPIVPPVDAAVDAQGAELLPFLDVGQAADTKVLVVDSGDAQPSGAETKPDTASLPDANPDAAGLVVNEDAATPPVNKDAAPGSDDLKILGGGFCAIAGSHSTSSAPFVLMGLAALALLSRRRTRNTRNTRNTRK